VFIVTEFCVELQNKESVLAMGNEFKQVTVWKEESAVVWEHGHC
jgi:NAD/NADP transhydrogenase alpha subunit